MEVAVNGGRKVDMAKEGFMSKFGGEIGSNMTRGNVAAAYQ